MFEQLVANHLSALGYRGIQNVRVTGSQEVLQYQAILAHEVVNRLANAYFGPEQMMVFQDLEKRGRIEFLVMPDRKTVLTLDNMMIDKRHLEQAHRRTISELELVLKCKARMDFGYIRREVRQKIKQT